MGKISKKVFLNLELIISSMCLILITYIPFISLALPNLLYGVA